MNRTARRTYYLDNLKLLLTVMVVVHHAADTYAAPRFWAYQSPVHAPWLDSMLGVNAAFFMGLFLMISGYFHPGAVDRKGVRAFTTDRLRRLGIPLVVYFLTVVPVLMYTYYIHYRHHPAIAFPVYYAEVFFGLGGKPADWAGPSWPDFNFMQMWFVEHLLIYALLYAAWRAWRRNRPVVAVADGPLPEGDAHACIFIYAVALAFSTAMVDVAGFPQGRWTGFLGFIQMEPHHFPQYASLFVTGLVAYRRDWFRRLPSRVGYFWLGVGIVLALGVYAHRILYVFPDDLWVPYEAFLCVSLCAGLLVLFREKFDRQGPFLATLSANAYSVYIVHFPIVVALQYAIHPAHLHPLACFVIVAVCALPISFLAAHFGLRRLPYARSIL